MVCFDKSNCPDFEMHFIKGSIKRTAVFKYNEATQETPWRLILYNPDLNAIDYVELHLRERQMSNKMPEGYRPWVSEKKCTKIPNFKSTFFSLKEEIKKEGKNNRTLLFKYWKRKKKIKKQDYCRLFNKEKKNIIIQNGRQER